MSWAVYITHPQVIVDPSVPVPKWGLSELGLQRARTFAARGRLPPGIRIVSSTETKALQLAEILAQACGSKTESDPTFGENDRSATGFLPVDQFETHADRFFATPEESVSGWERAIDAQARIVDAVARVLARHDSALPLAFVGHGAVGTLLKCHLGHRTISRSEDQHVLADPGGGNLFAFELEGESLLCDWTPIESWQGIGEHENDG